MLVGWVRDVAASHWSAERAREVRTHRVERGVGPRHIDYGEHEHVIAPHHGRAPAASRDVNLPGDVLRRAPALGQSLIVCRHARAVAAELRPILRVCRRRQQQGADESDQPWDGARHEAAAYTGPREMAIDPRHGRAALLAVVVCGYVGAFSSLGSPSAAAPTFALRASTSAQASTSAKATADKSADKQSPQLAATVKLDTR